MLNTNENVVSLDDINFEEGKTEIFNEDTGEIIVKEHKTAEVVPQTEEFETIEEYLEKSGIEVEDTVPTKSTPTTEATTSSNKSYIKRELEKKGFTGDVIDLGDGEEVSISDLTPEQEEYILDHLVVDPNFKYLKEAYEDGSIDGVIQLLKENGYIGEDDTEAPTSELDYYSNDEIYLMDLQERCPDCTQEELHIQLDAARNTEQFGKLVENIRDRLYVQEQKRKEYEYEQQLNEDRQEIMSQVQEVNELYGYENNSELMEHMLPYATNLSEDGEHSVFIDYLLSNPKEQYKHIFLHLYGDEIMSNMEAQLKEAYEEGRKSVIKSFPQKPKNKVTTTKKKEKSSGRDGVISLDDLII